MRDKTFYINAIKMDLFRVVIAAGDVRKELPVHSVEEFLIHAQNDFKKVDLTEAESRLQNELIKLSSSLDKCTHDNQARLQWTEKILTVRCRL